MFRWKRLLLVIGFVLILIILQSRLSGISGPFKGLLGNVLNPIVHVTSNLFSGIGSIWDSYINLIGVAEENNKQKELINSLTLENSLLKERVRMSEHLETLMKFSKAYDFSTESANVIGVNNGYMKHIIIDRGTMDGISVHDPVIGFKGLVGRVSRVFLSTSEVEITLSPSMNVSVLNSRTRASGVLKGDGTGRLFVDYYDRLDAAEHGDLFITSGLGRLFPKGIIVGTITGIDKEKTGLFQKIYIEQVEDFYKLENVFVVKNIK